MAQHLDSNPVIRIDSYFISYLQRLLQQILRALQHDRLDTMLHAYPETIRTKKFGDLRDRSRHIVTQISDNDVGLIDQDARTFLQFCDADPRINIAIVVGPSDNDLGSFLIWTA